MNLRRPFMLESSDCFLDWPCPVCFKPHWWMAFYDWIPSTCQAYVPTLRLRKHHLCPKYSLLCSCGFYRPLPLYLDSWQLQVVTSFFLHCYWLDCGLLESSLTHSRGPDWKRPWSFALCSESDDAEGLKAIRVQDSKLVRFWTASLLRTKLHKLLCINFR